MKRRLAPLGAAALALLVATAVACGDMSDSAFGTSIGDGDGDGGGADAGFGSDAAAVPGVGAVSGVVILHAAAFPSFRVCFENYPELPPQPDVALMPAANVVGVEVGSVIRIGSLDRPPGKVYVIDQRDVRATPRDPLDRKCGALIAGRDLVVNRHYQLAGELTTPLGVGQVDLLAITGCGGKSWLDELGASSDDCADWDQTAGSLLARTVELVPSVIATDTTLPVQVIHMASLLEAKRAPGEAIDVTFGALDSSDGGRSLEQTVIANPPLFEAGAPKMLAVDQTSDAVFGTHGFRIALRPIDDPAGAAAPTFFVDQSLAEVQELSFSPTVPTTYYRSASNYALLLVGDPRITPSYADGGANPGYDRRRAVHLLAVPVKDDVEDAGAPSVDDAGATDQ